ncbi:mitogen-activated protein kinase kinase kinase 5-like [Vicia villosa]|uniref:mitogen-activated protein kinase kinase kinase 5-like n=1 Tax=Vicia villosa TaxID=3911 RepID=UPI00273CBC64|nr:mitogen-activated protein kinase kinase kinase 5-like [Vicia villosa]
MKTEVGDQLGIYMEYVNPGSLQKFMQEHNGALTESVVRNFTRHILSGVVCLHSTETFPRDVKGANLLVDPSGIVKLAGFGVSKTVVTLFGMPHSY